MFTGDLQIEDFPRFTFLFLLMKQATVLTRRPFAELHHVQQLPLPFLRDEILVTHTLVIVDTWDYCNAFYMGLALKNIWKLQAGSECSCLGVMAVSQ